MISGSDILKVELRTPPVVEEAKPAEVEEQTNLLQVVEGKRNQIKKGKKSRR
jgi:hypothetical protein